MKRLILILSLFISFQNIMAQIMPSMTENLGYAVTFGNEAHYDWGDDDHIQIVFFIVPKDRISPFYIRIFDPDVGGKNDALFTTFNTSTSFEIYGGNECYSNTDARSTNPKNNFKSGSLLDKKTFTVNKQTDNQWYTFGPFNPREGELIETYQAYLFKLIVEGGPGDDGNLYKVSLSEEKDENIAIDGGNIFTYEYTFRLISQKGTLSHITPFIGDNIEEIHINTFDFDHDGEIFVYSTAKYRHVSSQSGNGDWNIGIHEIVPEEYNASLDIQIVKGSTYENDLTMYLTNKYKQAIPMFSVPIGGLPVYPLKVNTESFFDD